MNKKDGALVFAKNGEDFESLYKRFKKKVNKSSIIADVKAKMYYEKPSDKKRRKKNESLRKIKDKQNKTYDGKNLSK